MSANSQVLASPQEIEQFISSHNLVIGEQSICGESCITIISGAENLNQNDPYHMAMRDEVLWAVNGAG